MGVRVSTFAKLAAVTVATTVCALSSAAHAENLAVCHNLTGQAFFPTLGSAPSTWLDDRFTGTLIITHDTAGYDVVTVPKTGKRFSARKDGGEVVLKAQHDGGLKN